MQLPEFIKFITQRHSSINFINSHISHTGVRYIDIGYIYVEDSDLDLDRDVWEASKDIGAVINDPFCVKDWIDEERVRKSGKAITAATGGSEYELLYFKRN